MPELPEGMPKSNYVPTVGNGTWFVLFRWYGPLAELFPSSENRWTTRDFEKMQQLTHPKFFESTKPDDNHRVYLFKGVGVKYLR